MNQIAILYLLALFCISFVSGYPSPPRHHEICCQIQEACLEEIPMGQASTSQTFNTENGKIYLYKLTDQSVTEIREGKQLYRVGNNSDTYSIRFQLTHSNTIVTEENVTIYDNPTTITITTMRGKNFVLYQYLFPSLGSYSETFPVRKIYKGMIVWDRKHVIEAYEFKSEDDWVFVVRDNGTPPEPRLIFAGYGVKSATKSSAKDVAIVLRIRNAIPITIEFVDSTVADNFYKLLKPLIKK